MHDAPFLYRDTVSENELVLMKVNNNAPDQAMLGEFPTVVDNAILESHEAHQNQMMQLLQDLD
jgi:type I restriction enzyme R subunit